MAVGAHQDKVRTASNSSAVATLVLGLHFDWPIDGLMVD